ncbi:MAG: tetratricopeptide repeat protein [Vulcanimicrobiota bacterium]
MSKRIARRRVKKSRRTNAAPSTSAVLGYLRREFPHHCREDEDAGDLCGVLWELGEELQAAGDPRLLEVAQQIESLKVGIPDVHLMLAAGYLQHRCYARAYQKVQQFLRIEPDGPGAPDARVWAETLAETVSRLGLRTAAEVERAAAHEEMQLLLNGRRYRQAEQLAKATLRTFPDDLPSLNNRSLAEFHLGLVEKAERTALSVLGKDPTNIHALANLVHFSLHLGRKDQALDWAQALKKAEKSGCLPWTKAAEALAFLGDDTGILDLFGQVDHSQYTAMLLHLAAVASSRLGDGQMACGLWRDCLELEPSFTIAQRNLDNSREPDHLRAPAWPFSLSNWLTETEMKKVKEGLSGSKRPVDLVPALRSLLPVVLDRGCPDTVDLFLELVAPSMDANIGRRLAEFATGQTGSEQARLKAARICREAGMLPAGEMKFWRSGAWTTVQLMGFELTWESHGKPHPHPVAEVGDAGLKALQQGRLEEAEAHFCAALELVPEAPDLLNNLTVVAELKGQQERALELLERNHRLNPSYLRASLGLAVFRVRQGRLEEAEALLTPVLQRTKLHFAELAMLCDAQLRLLGHKKAFDAAASWAQSWDLVEEQVPECARYRPESMKNRAWTYFREAVKKSQLA